MPDDADVNSDEPSTQPDHDRAERRWRLRIILIAAPAVVAAVLFLIRVSLPEYYLAEPERLPYPVSLVGYPLTFVGTVSMLLALSIAGAMWTYLQTGFRRRSTPSAQTARSYSDAAAARKAPSRSTGSIGASGTTLEIARKLIELQARVDRLSASDSPAAQFNDEQRRALVDQLTERVEHEAANNVIERLRRELPGQEIEDAIATTLVRLARELEALSFRGNVNLLIGIVTTVVGVVALGFRSLRPTYDRPCKGQPMVVLSRIRTPPFVGHSD